MKEAKLKLQRKSRRLIRTRKKLLAAKTRARLTVFRSNNHIYAQIIDDVKGATLVAATEKEIEAGKMNNTQKAEALGKKIAEKALSAKIKNVVFDKGAYRYHGRVKMFAEAARAGGLVF